MSGEILLKKLVQFGLYGVLLTPLLISSSFLFPFLSLKVVVFQILVELVFVLWLWLAVLNPNFRPNFSLTFLGLTFYLVWVFFSAFTGMDFYRSFWGISERLTGVFLESHFFVLFLTLAGFFKTDFNRWINFLTFSFWVSIIVAFSALYQYFLPYLGITNSIFTRLAAERVSGFFGSPGFLAPYLLFHIFFGFWLFIKKLQEEKLKAFLYLTSSLFLIWVLLFGATRGAVLGLAFGILFLLFSFSFGSFDRRFKIFFRALLLALIIAFVFLWIGRNTTLVQNIPFLARFTQFSSGTPRLIAWQVALKGAGERLLFGVGPENFNYLFNKYYEPRLLKFGIGETWFDKPHNAFLEIITEEGLLGFLAFILIFIFLGKVLWSLYKSENKTVKSLSVVLGAAFLSYLGQNFFLFDSFGSWFAFFIFIAFLASLDQKVLNFRFLSLKFYVSLALLFSFLLLFGLYLNYTILMANIWDARALKTFGRNPAQGITFFKKAISFDSPYKQTYQLDFAASVFGALEKSISIPDFENNVNLVLDMIEDEILARHPNDVAVYLNLVNFFGILGEKSQDKEFLDVARDYGKKAMELSPRRQEVKYQLSRIELLSNNFSEAISLSRQALGDDSSIAESHWFLGLSLIAGQESDEGREEVRKALDLGYQLKNQAEKNFIEKLFQGGK